MEEQSSHSCGCCHEAEEVHEETNWALLALSGLCAVGAEIIHWLNGGNHWSVIILALIAILTGGLETFKKGFIALKKLDLNMNALMSIAVTGAMIIGQWPEAAMVIFLFALAEIIEERSGARANKAISGLMTLAPDTATVLLVDKTWASVEAKTVQAGIIARVAPGERIALDGVITKGASTINQAPITGESLPVEKTIGSQVFAGTINESGSFEYRVTSAASNSTLARIIKVVESAGIKRAPTQRFVDQFARIYTPSVFVMAVLVAVIPPVFFDALWMTWIYKALVLLVISCPCALVISTPVTVVSALATAAHHGIVVKGGVFIEEGRRLKTIAMDKTGTITKGKPEITGVEILSQNSGMDFIHLSLSLAVRSDHPVSKAITRHETGNTRKLLDVTGFTALAGQGVSGNIEGVKYYLGNHHLIEELGICSSELEAKLENIEKCGNTSVIFADEKSPLVLFSVADEVKETSKNAIGALHSMGLHTVMLTGDNPYTAGAIAKEVGIDRALGNLLPEDKMKEIESLKKQLTSGKVAMVGDGINDAPALAVADISFSMAAAGSDTAIETADVALMDDDLRKIPFFISLSRKTCSILVQNISLALGIKAVFMALAFMGLATMWMAVFADMGVSLIVVFNGLRLLRIKELF